MFSNFFGKMKAILALLLLAVCNDVRSQCYIDSDIAIHWSQLPRRSPFQEDSNQCLANYTIFNEDHIDIENNFVTINIDKGVNCSRRDSTNTNGTWTYEAEGTVYDCSDITGNIRCEREPGSVTLYTAFGCCGDAHPNGVYTCCIEGDCISIRVYQSIALGVRFPNINDAVIESCSIIPPSDITVIPQQYIVQMNTSGVPPIRLMSNIDCTSNCGDITRGESYYSLIDLTDERYQYSVPYTRSADISNTSHQYNCRAIFGKGGKYGIFLGTTLTTSITASNILTINNYEVINATAVRVQWSITGDFNGFVINITSSGLSTVTQQLTDSEFVYDGLLPERDYTVEVRGYYELLGLADTITIRLKASITSVNGSLLTVSEDLSIQEIEVDCYTFRVEPHQVTWSIDLVSLTSDSSYHPVNGSELLDSANQTYRHYITLNGSFSHENIITCYINVNGKAASKDFVLQAGSSSPTGLSIDILSSTSVSVNWSPLSNVTGYIIQYTPNGRSRLLNGENTSSVVLEGLAQETTYQIYVYSYQDLPSETSSNISVFLDATAASSNSGLVAGATLGSAVAILSIIVVVLVIVFILRKSKMVLLKKESKAYKKSGVHYLNNKPVQKHVEMDIKEKSPDDPYSAVYSEVTADEADTSTYINTTGDGSDALYCMPSDQGAVIPLFDPMIPEIYPVHVYDLSDHVTMKHSNMNSGFREEFKTLYTGEEKSCAIGQRDEYKLLNRFKDITVYDDTRIILKGLPINTAYNEFINGGYIDGYYVPKKYIATQGPLQRTVGDFWHMVWQEKVQSIVMLTNLIEEKKKKCARYWPEEVGSSETYGHFNVTNLEEEPLMNFVIRTLRVKLMGTSDSVIVKHYQYTTWPDYGVPESVSPFMTLNRRVMNSWNKDKGPMIVHCSAGVGRTGTFIAMDMALKQAEKEGKIDIAGIVSRLREQRMKMVQTDGQYAFIHDAILEAVIAGSTEITLDMFNAEVMKWRQPESHTGTAPIQTQFQLLGKVTPDQDDVIKQTAERFPKKNRSMQFLPPEKYRVLLKGEVPDYIHATFIHGYQEKKAFILAQSPMQNTVRDFWKMIMNYKVSAIVMCCGEQENGREMCFPYWDQNAPVRFDDLIVEVKLVTQKVGFIQRDLKVIDDKANSMNVVQFQLTSWPESGVLKSPQMILEVLDSIGRVRRKSGKGPVVVHCSDTVGRSGAFCVVSNAIEQCKTEQLVDVFQATKAVRMNKPGAVTSLDQYDSLHDIILMFIEQNSSYSNFQGNFQ